MGFEPMDSVVEPRVVADLCIFGLEESYDDTGKQEVSIYVLSQPGFLRQYTNIHKLQGKPCLSTTTALNMMPILSLQGSDSPQSVNRVYIYIYTYIPNIK